MAAWGVKRQHGGLLNLHIGPPGEKYIKLHLQFSTVQHSTVSGDVTEQSTDKTGRDTMLTVVETT
jgi:hypothetical protein